MSRDYGSPFPYTRLVPPHVRKIHDDRNRPACFATLDDLHRLHKTDRDLESILNHTDPRNVRLFGPMSRTHVVWTIGLVALYTAVSAVTASFPMFVQVFVAAAAIILALAIGGVYWQRALGRAAFEIRAILIKKSLCPSCTHSLTGLPLQSDGCVVCPECGAAWRPANPVHSTGAADLPPVP